VSAMWIVDRFENGFAVLEREDGALETVLREALPPGAREGSVLRKDEEGFFALDLAEEQARREAMHQLQNDLFL